MAKNVESFPINGFEQYLVDEAALIKGTADKIFFPRTPHQVAEIIIDANINKIPVSISGGGTGLSGGRVPLGGWIIATDKMVSVEKATGWRDPVSGIEYGLELIEVDDSTALLRVPVAMPLQSIQDFCKETGWYYPPDPTERTSFIGGNVATNASGARTFKYGPTKEWVYSIKVVDPRGRLLEISMNDPIQRINELFDEDVSIPKLTLPNTSKHVAGPVIGDNLIDVFIGSGGMFGVIIEVTLKLIRPKDILNMFVFCPSISSALELVKICRHQLDSSSYPVALSVEYVDARCINIMKTKKSSLPDSDALIILEQEYSGENELDKCLEFYLDSFEKLGIEDTMVAQTFSEIESHKELRHIIPETVNTLVKGKGQAKLGTDFAVPHERYGDLLNRCMTKGEEFERLFPSETIGYAIWSHAGDSHIHLNFLPQTTEETQKAKEFMLELMKLVVSWDGTIAAEHGLGKKIFNNKPALFYQFGDDGIYQIHKLKKQLDPNNILNQGNLVPIAYFDKTIEANGGMSS
ncbi:MAG: FAD-binding oxidoreductase [Candidatus Heimdallarchaeota archaeon]|nr:FAD-binding oxidoreductase [Candidatus Heimdallarchaeota archaeon]